MNNLDWNALRAGGSVALVFAIPFSIAARIVADGDDSSGTAAFLSLAAVRRLRARRRRGRVDATTAAAAEARDHLRGRYVRDRPSGVHHRPRLRGDEIRWLAAIFNLTAVAVAGLIGGAIGGAMHRRGFFPTSNRSST